MSYLSADDILKADDLPVREVEVPQWPGDDGKPGIVRVRGLTGIERDKFEFRMAAARKDPDNAQVRAEIVGRCIVDEDGKRVFTDKQIGALGTKSGAALDLVFDVVRDLSGMGDDAAKEAAEDFGDAPSDGSPSG